MPEYEKVKQEFKSVLLEGYITRTIVNSEPDIETILDDSGQLKLRTPFNIFIGGQILDRGITVANLIGFYYGRKPQKMQQDTVLQHARMYGYRDKKDLAVTRFYTTEDLYYRLKKVNDFDKNLRMDFEKGNNIGVVFIGKDSSGKVIPCSPQKILISNTQVLKGGQTLFPQGFQTKNNIKSIIASIDKALMQHNSNIDGDYVMDIDDVLNIIDLIYKTFDKKIPISNRVDVDTFKSVLRYVSKDNTNINIHCRTGRNVSRFRGNNEFTDAPYNGTSDLTPARQRAIKIPTLMLIKQKGSSKLGWMGEEFYWPILVIPQEVETSVYTSEMIK